MICCEAAPPLPEPLLLDDEVVEVALVDDEVEDEDAVSPDEAALVLLDEPPLPVGPSLLQAPIDAPAVTQREMSKNEGVS
jgi:hypothetical protein